MECIFCRIAEGKAPAWVLYEDERVKVILDIYPVSKGHSLVITRNHYESIHDADPRDVAHAFTVAAALSRIFREKLGAPGVNVIVNSGRAAGQEIFHFHIHVIPRWEPGGWRALFRGRHFLTEAEAREVVRMVAPHTDVIREYVSMISWSGQ
ncbi:MAG: HIT family protein [Desulfurococcales archaeon]|nr:HIT family protein [Desulfurococcales archaeon]